jgi:serine protease Do
MRLLTALLAACICASVAHADVPPEPLPEATVVILTPDGHGSGFYIGNDILVTAAHVVAGAGTTVKVEPSFGPTINAAVIFVDHRADLAFVRARGLRLQVAELACRKPVLGENIMVRGAPSGMRGISTWGRVAGDERAFPEWLAATPLNVMAAPGNSGGGVWDERGKIIGVLVGIGRSAGAQFISLAVPAMSVCRARDYLRLE